MAVRGPAPRPPGQTRRRNKPAHEWTVVPDVPFRGGPRLPRYCPPGRPWPPATKRWWAVVSSMPHCRLWIGSDWAFALDTAIIAAEFHAGNMRVAGELRHREKVMGTTADALAGLRIRYVPAVEAVAEPRVEKLEDYRDL